MSSVALLCREPASAIGAGRAIGVASEPAGVLGPSHPGLCLGHTPGGRTVDSGRRPTLDELVTRAWEEALAGGPAACPVCGGRLALAAGRGGPDLARCDGCGSELS